MRLRFVITPVLFGLHETQWLKKPKKTSHGPSHYLIIYCGALDTSGISRDTVITPVDVHVFKSQTLNAQTVITPLQMWYVSLI